MNKSITTIEAAFAAKGLAPVMPDLTNVPLELRDYLNAQYQLAVVVEAINEGWKPDWNDTDQKKYFPWFWVNIDSSKPTGFGLSYAGADCDNSYTSVGSRLCFETREAAIFAGETFTELYERVYLINP